MSEEAAESGLYDHHFTLLCDYVWSGERGKNAYMGTFSTIYVVKFPGGLPLFSIVTGWHAAAVVGKAVNVTLENVDGTWVQDAGTARLEPVPDRAAQRLHSATGLIIANANGIDFPAPDNYWVVIRVDGVIRHKHPFNVEERANLDAD